MRSKKKVMQLRDAYYAIADAFDENGDSALARENREDAELLDWVLGEGSEDKSQVIATLVAEF